MSTFLPLPPGLSDGTVTRSGTTTISSGLSATVRFFAYSAPALLAPRIESISRAIRPWPGLTMPLLRSSVLSSSKTKVMPRSSGIGFSRSRPSASVALVGVLFITPPSTKRTVSPLASLMCTGLKTPGKDAEACTATATGRSGSVSALKT